MRMKRRINNGHERLCLSGSNGRVVGAKNRRKRGKREDSATIRSFRTVTQGARRGAATSLPPNVTARRCLSSPRRNKCCRDQRKRSRHDDGLGLLQGGDTMTKDLKNLIDNIYQLATNSRDTDAIIRMIGIIHAVDEELLVLTKERDEARRERDEARRMYCSMVENNTRHYGTSAKSVATQVGWDCFKETP